MTDELSTEARCSESCFTEYTVEKSAEDAEAGVPEIKWSDKDYYQPHYEALYWKGRDFNEVEGA